MKHPEGQWNICSLSAIKIHVERHACQVDGVWAPITTEMLQSTKQFTRNMLCEKEHFANWINSRFCPYLLSSMLLESFPLRERLLGLLVAYSCLVGSCFGSWGLIYKGAQKADGDVTVRKGPCCQQNRCTEQQTASSCCEEFLLIFGCGLSDTHTHTHSWKSRQPRFFKTEARLTFVLKEK